MTRRVAWSVFVILVLVEWAVFRQFYVRELLPSFPRMYDQAAYLGRVLDLYELWRTQGFIAGLRQSLTWPWPQGLLLPHEAAFGFFFLGPGRLSAVTINFAHLALLQALLVWLGLRARRPLTAFALCGVLLSAGASRTELGGLPDFRLDFAGYALMTAIGLLVVYSDGFRSRRASIAIGLLGGVACLTRTILFTYLVAGAGLWLLTAIVLRRRPGVRERLINASLAAGLTLTFMAPTLIAQFRALDGYYVSHVTSGESKLRAREFGVHTRLDQLTYYVKSVLAGHAGRAFLAGAAALLGLVYVRWRSANRAADAVRPLLHAEARWAGLFVVLVGTAAWLILTGYGSPSPVVGNVFVPLIVAGLWVVVGTTHAELGSDWERPRWFAAGLLVLFLAGALTFVVRWTRPSALQPAYTRHDARPFIETADWVAAATIALDNRSPKISFDEVTEYFLSDVVRVLAYERHGVLLTPQTRLGAIRVALPAVTREQALADLQDSDFALLGADRPAAAPPGIYPVNQSLQTLAADLVAWATTHMVPVRDASFFGRRITVFAKPTAACKGSPGEWITAAGMDCRMLGAVLRERPIFQFEGGANAEYLRGDPGVSARIQRTGRAATETACSYERREGSGFQPYTVTCALCPSELQPAEVVDVHIRFDRSFVPREIGLNEDPRALVVQWPVRTDMAAGACAGPATGPGIRR